MHPPTIYFVLLFLEKAT